MRVDNDTNKVEKNKNYQICLFISLLISILGLIMGLLAFRDHNKSMIIVSAVYAVLMLLTFLYILITKRTTIFSVVGGSIMLYLEINFILKGGSGGFGIIWVSIMPLFTVYLLSSVQYYVINAVYLLVLIVFFWTPLRNNIYEFTETFVRRFPIVYIIDFLFGGFLQFRIRKTELELKEQKKILDKEIKNAGLIQRNFYTQVKEPLRDWNVSYYTKPMVGVSGDLYDIYTKGDRLDGFGVFDISGHGISSGILTLLTKTIIHQEFYANTQDYLWKVVNNINTRYVDEKGDVSNYFTGILARVKDSQVELVNAAHPSPLYYKKETNSFELIKNHPNAVGPVGMSGLPAVFVSQYIAMESGDEIVLYTDGLLECQNPDGAQYSVESLQKCLEHNIHEDVETQINAIFDDLKNFMKGAASTDDITMIILQKK